MGSYIDDHAFDGAAFVTFVRSTEAHARIAEIDVTEALRAPGVVADHYHLARTSPWSTSTWRPER